MCHLQIIFFPDGKIDLNTFQCRLAWLNAKWIIAELNKIETADIIIDLTEISFYTVYNIATKEMVILAFNLSNSLWSYYYCFCKVMC